MINRAGLAAFLRNRRESLQPEDVGLPRGSRRRTNGLRREEVSLLCHISTDYYSRLEQERGPQPSEQMIASIAQGLHLSLNERDYIYELAGYRAPKRMGISRHISPGMLRIFDRLDDTPAEIVTELGETLRQTPLGIALTGDTTTYLGLARSVVYRWFTDPSTRSLFPEADHEDMSRFYVSGLRMATATRGVDSPAGTIVASLEAISAEFRALWKLQVIEGQPDRSKRFFHSQVGLIELDCQVLYDPQQSHSLLVYTAHPGSESAEKLRLLSIVGAPVRPHAGGSSRG